MKTLTNSDLDQSQNTWPDFMQRAIDLACNAIGTQPNPRVGCVLVKEGRVVADGWHQAAGLPHAEIMALRNAGDESQGATAFVSLEPCCHHGKTGPCTEALIDAGVSRVVFAMQDPNPKVSGNGIDQLEQTGIEVFHLSDFETKAKAVNAGFVRRHETGMPFVRLKLGMSLDGRTALSNGESKWITGQEARADVQLLRATSSAILTGIGTVLADDPRLDVRMDELALSEAQLQSNQDALKRQPMRVILDSSLKTPVSAKILNNNARTLLFTCSETLEPGFSDLDHVEILQLDYSGDQYQARVHLPTVLKSLASDYDCNDLLVEAGSTLGGAFLEEGLVDELIVYIAPKLLGSDSRPLLQLEKIQTLANAPNFSVSALSQIGDDIKLVLTPK